MRLIRLALNHLSVLTAVVWLPVGCIPLFIAECASDSEISSKSAKTILAICLLAVLSLPIWATMGLFYVFCDNWEADSKRSRTRFICMYRELFIRGTIWFWNFDDADSQTDAARSDMIKLISKVTGKKFKDTLL